MHFLAVNQRAMFGKKLDLSHTLDRYEERPELRTEQLFGLQTVNNEMSVQQIVHHAVVLICDVEVLIILTKRNV